MCPSLHIHEIPPRHSNRAAVKKKLSKQYCTAHVRTRTSPSSLPDRLFQPTQSTFDNIRFYSAHLRVRSWTGNKNDDWGIAQPTSSFVCSLHYVFIIVNKDRAVISTGRYSEASSTGYEAYKTRFHTQKKKHYEYHARHATAQPKCLNNSGFHQG
jgi:hypothetical protein